jgi:hypothetical protein
MRDGKLQQMRKAGMVRKRSALLMKGRGDPRDRCATHHADDQGTFAVLPSAPKASTVDVSRTLPRDHVPNSDPDPAKVISTSPNQGLQIWLYSAVSGPPGRPTEPKVRGSILSGVLREMRKYPATDGFPGKSRSRLTRPFSGGFLARIRLAASASS